MESCVIQTPLGSTTITGNINGISSVSLSDKSLEETVIPESLKACVQQLGEYFQGTRHEFELKLNPEGTDFQKRVWKALLQVPYGKTKTYLELSRTIGDAKAIRAVAAANGKNPLWIIVPCHRIIGSDGSLVGYAGGLGRKKWLLNHESAVRQVSLF
ncbi:MAG: methylated-DNA--[protein]-cysteine S-methyltransferase [Flavobacteriaceae bacterium]|nr:methylated-DNA--[protein]-cysteine S-methyltransferase [Bacteroidia bacterium]NNK88336.1 methylated-DNA--[protein]-cysteine S-methyltransferase [Flavobacteriaceae bacterium]